MHCRGSRSAGDRSATVRSFAFRRNLPAKHREDWLDHAGILAAGMPLVDLHCDFKPDRDAEILRSIKTLEGINYKPAAEFWKDVEEQRKGKKP